MKLGNAVALMVDCCQFQEYQELAFRNYLTANQIAVLLSSLQIDIIQMPSFRDKIYTTVKIYGCQAFYGLRRITMHNEYGNLCLIANAAGAFFNLKTMRAVKIDPDACGIKFDTAEDMECLPRKITIPTVSGTPLPALTVKRSGVDSNGHLTSSAYFSIAEDALPEEFTYNRVRLEYKQQAKLKSLILPVIYSDMSANTIVVDMKSGNGTSYGVAEFSSI